MKSGMLLLSSMAVVLTGCNTTHALLLRPAARTAKEAQADQSASKSYDLALQALQKGDMDKALLQAEQAVALSPRDAAYRMLLGDLYLKNGRFLSAEMAFSDLLLLDPGNVRARFNLALAGIALGKNQFALAQLGRLENNAAAGDLGLAYALAGQTDRAVLLLESAAREKGADGRIRQNLALAYALSGDWRRARAVAAQDLSPADLGARMEQWALFAKPNSSHDQVASLLGVTPSLDDAGQPIRLALAPEAPSSPARTEAANEVTQYAQAAVTTSDPEPVGLAATETPESTSPVPVAVAEESTQTPVKAVQAGPQTLQKAALPATKFAKAPAMIETPRSAASSAGRYVVQLGAYRSAGMVDTTWASVRDRYHLDGHFPVRAQVTLAAGTFHRLALGGFASQRDAARVCLSIKSKGGDCFVRPTFNDVPLRFAARDARRPA